MSTDEQELMFESFLKKRKDKMKLKWATYWFRLQNTSLFFYTKKHGSALHLRGQYYIYMVQSVREVTRNGSMPFAFEIAMKNGKTKLLAAETVELRHTWVSLLWKAMQLPGPGRSDSACIWDDVADLKQRAQDSLHCSSDSDGEMNLKDSEHLYSAPIQSDRSASSQKDSEHLYSTPIQWDRSASSQNDSEHLYSTPIQWDRSASSQNDSEHLYSAPALWDWTASSQDSLASAEKHTLHPEEDRQQEMAIYDIPPSNMKASGEDGPPGCKDASEGIYDVPTSWPASMPEQALRTPAGGERSPDSVTTVITEVS
ncbi:hypothetical protein SKAU_G00123290 [Synaphobranchus kaupii]|uniref:PH domain-containing protein n=1 Tax=Synaphobranchus kaupii TaxID=118154 RepID=A0A9Q1J2M2_SYNKA|nr:hypothetical protein SKAU_G00123290 [Synaphobranchus kaupii]